MSAPSAAYLARGRIHLLAGGAVRSVDSRFGESVRERTLEIDQRHSWKTQGRGAQFMQRGMLWGAGQGPAGVQVNVSSLSPGREAGELLYALETRDIAGVFALRDGGQHEQRLFHGNDRRVRHLAARPGHGWIACSVGHDQGNAAIAVMQADGSDFAEVTEGDSVDQAPAWVPGEARALVFQSAGIARDKEGQFAALGPFAVRRLDLDQRTLDTVAEDPAFDMLGPRVAPDGALFYIRRPWRAARGGSFWGAMTDFILFPWRLLYAVFQWLNFFSARYAGRPLTTAGGPKREGADLRQMMVWGNLIDAEAAARESAARGDDTPDLVPSTWQLVRQRQGAKAEVVAKGVLSFDLAADGSVLYTNGSAIYRLDAAGARERLCADAGIEQVVALG